MKIWSGIKLLLYGVPLGVSFADFVGYVARVDGVSMQPLLNPDLGRRDFVYLSRLSIRTYRVQRGDVCSIRCPHDPSQLMIKRVVALEGDWVHTLDYKVPLLQVPTGHCWVEGDHRGHSLDSNYFGPIPVGLITAKATRIVWPPARWQKLNSILPLERMPINLLSSE